jgi:hypothetical protein
MILPTELAEKIYYDYIPLYTANLRSIHTELLHEDGIFLRLTNHRFDFHMDYEFAERLPELIYDSDWGY